MKCEKCQKNEATVFYRENINGKEAKYHLCPKCAAELEKESGTAFQNFFAGDLLGSVFAPISRRSEVSAENEKCSLCGCTFSFIQKNGKVGCPKCYESFASYLAPTVKRLHGSATHRGKVPHKFREKLSAKREAEQLEAELKAAVASEEYEKAAELRDKLREIRKGGNA